MWKTSEESVNVKKIIWKRDTRYTFFVYFAFESVPYDQIG